MTKSASLHKMRICPPWRTKHLTSKAWHMQSRTTTFKDKLWDINQLFGTKMKNNPFKMFFNFTKMHSSVKRSTSKVVFRQMHNKVVAVAWWTNYRAALLVNFGLSWFPGTLSLLVHLLVCLLFPSHSEVLLSSTVLKAIWWTGHSEYKEEDK